MTNTILGSEMASDAGLLPITGEYVRNSAASKKVRILMMQHALRDTADFVKSLLECGFAVDGFLAKPNSIEQESLSQIESYGINVIREPEDVRPYEWFEAVGNIDRILEISALKARRNLQKLVVVDVGGYFLEPLKRLRTKSLEHIAGVCEVTSFGHHRYANSSAALPVPVLSIARSPLKQAEAIFVGETVVQATEDVLRETGRVLQGKRCGVIGFGMIGKQIAHSLRKRGMNVSVRDADCLRGLEARLEGFEIDLSVEGTLSKSHVVFSATGKQAVSFKQIEKHAIPGAVFVSGGSRANEFDVVSLESLERLEGLSDHLASHVFPNGKTIHLVNNGKAANFLKSGTPEEVMDIVFAELFCCIERLAISNGGEHLLSQLDEMARQRIAKSWLQAVA